MGIRYKFREEDLKLVKIPFITDKISTKQNLSGIYCIYNVRSHKFYIGSAINLISRRSAHFRDLLKREHSNQYLQRSYNKYGFKSFVFVILEFVKNLNEDSLTTREQYYFDKYKPYDHSIGYNISPEAKVAVRLKGSKQLEEMISKNIKKFKVIAPDCTVVESENVVKFCEKHGLCNVGFCLMLRGKANHCRGWRLYKNQKIVNGKVDLTETIRLERAKKVKNTVSNFSFYKNGELIHIRNLSQFCKDNNLCSVSMGQIYRGERLSPYQGYTSGKSKELSESQNKLPKNQYLLLSPEGEKVQTNSLMRFAIENKFDRNKFYKGIRKESGYFGWKLLESKTKYGKSKEVKELLLSLTDKTIEELQKELEKNTNEETRGVISYVKAASGVKAEKPVTSLI